MNDAIVWSKDFLIGLAVGISIGVVVSRLSARLSKNSIVRSDPIDPAKVDPSVLSLIQSGHKIQAIKRYRELYKVDLKEAKEAVDQLGPRD